MIWLSGMILSMALSMTGDKTPPPSDHASEVGHFLSRAAKSGSLTLIMPGDSTSGRKTRIEAVEVKGCFIFFKTQISETGFTARVAELGKGSSLHFVPQKNEIELRSAPTVILRSEQPAADILDALQSIGENCAKANTIF